MNLFTIAKNYLTKKQKDSKAEIPTEVPDGVCPNCYGRQEYGGKFFEVLEDKKIDTNSIKNERGWIQAYAATNFEGITLKHDHDAAYECPSCKIKYKEQPDSKA